MASNLHPWRQRVWQSLASVRTGIILLLLVGVVAAAVGLAAAVGVAAGAAAVVAVGAPAAVVAVGALGAGA